MTGRRMLIGNISTTLLGYVPWILPYLPVKRIQQVRKGFEIVDKESSKILEQKKLDLKNGGIDFVGGGKDLITLLRKCSGFIDIYPQRIESDFDFNFSIFRFSASSQVFSCRFEAPDDRR